MAKKRKESELLDRQPPSDIAAERELLAGLYMTDCTANDNRAAHAFDNLDAMDFYDKFHAAVFDVMRVAWVKGEPFQTAATFLHACRVLGQNKSDRCSELMYAMREIGVANNIPWYCKRLRSLRKRRACVALASELLRRSFDDATEPGEWMLYATEHIDQFSRIGDGNGGSTERHGVGQG